MAAKFQAGKEEHRQTIENVTGYAIAIAPGGREDIDNSLIFLLRRSIASDVSGKVSSSSCITK